MDRRELQDDPVEAQRAALDGRQTEIWTALPGIVQGFDPDALTVTVQPAVRGSIADERGAVSAVHLPVLPDVPVVFPHGGGYSLTFPIQPGDECVVVFASRCIDGWWQSGGVQAPAEQRMHDLSDGIAIPGPWSQATKIGGVSTATTQLRSDDGQTFVEVDQGVVTLKAPQKIVLAAPLIEVEGAIRQTGTQGQGSTMQGGLTNTGGQVTSNGITLETHVHNGVEPGPGTTGGAM